MSTGGLTLLKFSYAVKTDIVECVRVSRIVSACLTGNFQVAPGGPLLMVLNLDSRQTDIKVGTF